MKQLAGRILLLASGVFLAGFAGVSAVIGSVPRIEGLNPAELTNGGIVRISGRDFGARRGPSVVLVADRRLPPERYVSWTDTEIRIRRSPEDPSGLVQVETRAGRSNPMLLSNPARLPSAAPSEPQAVIEAVTPERPVMGETVTIRGSGFGRTPGRTRIVIPFSRSSLVPDNPWAEDAWVASAESAREWSDTEIVVDLPPGIGAGLLSVQGRFGESNTLPLLPPDTAGHWELGEPVDLAIGYAIPDDGGGLLPLPFRSRLQPRIQDPVTSGRPAREGESADSREQLWLDAAQGQTVLRLVRRYPISSRIAPSELRGGPYPASVMRWTLADERYPHSDSAVQRALRRGPSATSSPWAQLQRSYDAVRAILEPDPDSEPRTTLDLLDGGPARPQDYAVLLTTYLRGLGFPARTVAGVIADGDSARVHNWVEVYLRDFGWLPLDPAAGDGAFPALTADIEDPASFYFGSLDAMRVALASPENGHAVPLGLSGDPADQIRVAYLFPL